MEENTTQQAKVEPKVDKADAEKNKALAIVGYIIPFLFFIPLITEAKDSKFAKFHANQQLNLLLFWVVGQVAAAVLAIILIGFLIGFLVWIGGIVFMIMGIINAANGEIKELPLIGKYELIK
jgi:uncharacterized membrane protein